MKGKYTYPPTSPPTQPSNNRLDFDRDVGGGGNFFFLIKSTGEVLSAFFRASQETKGEKVCVLCLKTMPEHFSNNSKKTSKKSRKQLFQPPKCSNHGCQHSKKWRILGLFSLYELYFCLVGTKKNKKIVPPNG